MKKNNALTYGIYFLIFAIYSLIVFLVFKDFNTIFWSAYGIAGASLLVHIFELAMNMKHTEDVKKFIGIPMVILTGIICVIELGVSLIFMASKDVIGIRPVILVMGIILILQIIVLFTSSIIKDTQNADAEKRKADVVFIKGVGVELDMMMGKCSDVKLKKELANLKEVVEYSDPISHPLVSGHEDNILEIVEALRVAVVSGDNIQAKELCSQTKDLFVERNKILLSVK